MIKAGEEERAVKNLERLVPLGPLARADADNIQIAVGAHHAEIMLAAQRTGIGTGERNVAIGALGDQVQRLIHIDGRALLLRNGRAERHFVLRGAGDSRNAQTHCQSRSHSKELLHGKILLRLV